MILMWLAWRVERLERNVKKLSEKGVEAHVSLDLDGLKQLGKEQMSEDQDQLDEEEVEEKAPPAE